MRALLITLFVAACAAASAQNLSLGIYAGAAKCFAHPVTQFEPGSPFSIRCYGIMPGVGLQADLYKNAIGVRTGIGYQRKDYSFIYVINPQSFPRFQAYSEITPTVSAIEIPVQLLYRKSFLKKKADLVLNAGPVIVFNSISMYVLYSSLAVYDNTNDTFVFEGGSPDHGFPSLPLSTDLQGGLGIETSRGGKSNFGIYAGYQYGFAKMPRERIYGHLQGGSYDIQFDREAETRLSYASLRLVYKPRFMAWKLSAI